MSYKTINSLHEPTVNYTNIISDFEEYFLLMADHLHTKANQSMQGWNIIKIL